jgi:hypothetical protein
MKTKPQFPSSRQGAVSPLAGALVVLMIVVTASAMAESPIKVVVNAQGSVDAAEVARLRTIVEESLARSVSEPRPLTVTIDLADMTLSYPEAGAERHRRAVDQLFAGSYTIADDKGRVIDWQQLRFPSTTADSRLDLMHAAASSIADSINRSGSRPRLAPPVSVVVTTSGGVDPAEGARLRGIVEESIWRSVRGGRQPLTVAISLAPVTAARPRMSGMLRRPTDYDQLIGGTYTLTNSRGEVVDSAPFGYNVADVGYPRLDSMHRAADAIAARIAKLHE